MPRPSIHIELAPTTQASSIFYQTAISSLFFLPVHGQFTIPLKADRPPSFIVNMSSTKSTKSAKSAKSDTKQEHKTKKFGKGERSIPHSSQKAKKFYPAEDEAKPRKVSNYCLGINSSIGRSCSRSASLRFIASYDLSTLPLTCNDLQSLHYRQFSPSSFTIILPLLPS